MLQVVLTCMVGIAGKITVCAGGVMGDNMYMRRITIYRAGEVEKVALRVCHARRDVAER